MNLQLKRDLVSRGIGSRHQRAAISSVNGLPVSEGVDGTSAFTLLEVMIAMALFFMAIFAILDLTTRSLAAARGLQRANLDVTSMATGLMLTNRIEEGSLPAEVIAQFEEQNPGYTCNGNISEVSSNGLFQIDFEIYGVKGKKVVASTMSILLFRPESAQSFRSKMRR